MSDQVPRAPGGEAGGDSSNEDLPADVLARLERHLQGHGVRPGLSPARLTRAIRTGAAERGTTTLVFAAAVLSQREAFRRLIDLVTVQESWFFRETPQLDALRHLVLPTLAGPVTVWSAGCANGQEAWSLAMLLDDAGIPDWQVVGTDVSSAAVARAAAGTYATDELKGLPDQFARRYLTARGKQWEVVPRLRRQARFAHHNLATDPSPVPPGSCHVVLCRNALIYLDPPAVQAALSCVGSALAPAGWLLMGAAESLWGVSDAFELVRVGDAFLYRRPAHDAAGATPVRRPAVPTVDDLLGAAVEAAGAGDDEQAARLFRQAVFLDPRRPEAHEGLAGALAALGLDQAAARARAAAQWANARR